MVRLRMAKSALRIVGKNPLLGPNGPQIANCLAEKNRTIEKTSKNKPLM